MTQHYLAGELSLLLGELEATTPRQTSERDIRRLRHLAETVPLTALPAVAAQAIALAHTLCSDSLEHGQFAAFSQQAGVCGELREFGVCAGLLDEAAF